MGDCDAKQMERGKYQVEGLLSPFAHEGLGDRRNTSGGRHNVELREIGEKLYNDWGAPRLNINKSRERKREGEL